MKNKELWEILVPTIMNNKSVRLKHHKNWDSFVRNIASGLTILRPAKGQWVYQDKIYEERVIPVRISCTEKQIKQIIKFTISHYKQIAVMAYRISDKVLLINKDDNNNK